MLGQCADCRFRGENSAKPIEDLQTAVPALLSHAAFLPIALPYLVRSKNKDADKAAQRLLSRQQAAEALYNAAAATAREFGDVQLSPFSDEETAQIRDLIRKDLNEAWLDGVLNRTKMFAGRKAHASVTSGLKGYRAPRAVARAPAARPAGAGSLESSANGRFLMGI